MTVIALGSVTGSPGVTRLAVGLTAAWPDRERRRVLVEADPDGGRLGAELGVGAEPGLMAIVLAVRARGMTTDELLERGAAPVADWHVVPAPPSAEQAHSALAHAAPALATLMTADPHGPVWVLDVGRLSTRSPALPFAVAADHVLLVTHGSFAALQLVPHRIEVLRAAGCTVSIAVVEPTPWSAREISDFVGADVTAMVPRARRDAGLAGMHAGAWRRWWRAVDALAHHLDSPGATFSDDDAPDIDDDTDGDIDGAVDDVDGAVDDTDDRDDEDDGVHVEPVHDNPRAGRSR